MGNIIPEWDLEQMQLRTFRDRMVLLSSIDQYPNPYAYRYSHSSLKSDLSRSTGYVIASHRYLVVETFGCQPALYHSVVEVALSLVPDITFCLALFVLAGKFRRTARLVHA